MNIKKILSNNLFVKKITFYLDQIIPPGFQGASLFSVLQFFYKGIINPRFNLYAGSLSWNFFLAIFPALIFLFTLIAYIPGINLQKIILTQMDFILPNEAYKVIKVTVADIVKTQRSGLLSIGFLSAIYFASNGVFSMMLAFDSNFNEMEKKKSNFFKKRGKSIFITALITVLIIISLIVLISGNLLSAYVIHEKIINKSIVVFFINIFQLATLSALVFFIMSSLYYFGPSSKIRWQFFSPGAIVATILSLVATYLFTSYVEDFNSYNKLYGSIGAVIVLMLLIYFNSLCILIGFELNKSISSVVKIHQEKRKKENHFLE
jgi:membrane protein